MTVVKYGSIAWVLQNRDKFPEEDVFQRNCLRIVLPTRLMDHISKKKALRKVWFKLAF